MLRERFRTTGQAPHLEYDETDHLLTQSAVAWAAMRSPRHLLRLTVLAVTVSIAGFLGPTGGAALDGDSTPPVLGEVLLPSESFDVSGNAVHVPITVYVTDDLAGVREVELSVMTPINTRFWATYNVSPYVTNGPVAFTLTLPQYAPSGEYFVASVRLTDGASNVSYSTWNSSNAPYRIEVTNSPLDAESPDIAMSANPGANSNGWWNTAVTFSFTCSDEGSGIATCADPVTITTEGANQTFTVTAIDNAGNEASLAVDGVNIDLTSPTVLFNGTQSSYTVAEIVDIDCTAFDELSGVASADCPDLSVPAAALGTGSHTLIATVSDLAGNTVTEAVTFFITADALSLGDLTAQYLESGGPGTEGMINALRAKLDRGNYSAFINQVNAQCCVPAPGKRFTAEEAATLTSLANGLIG